MTQRAVLFVDGNNWFHALKRIGVDDRGRLNYRKLSEKLVGPRKWLETRYYIGRMPQEVSPVLYAQQRSFLSKLASTDPRISVHLGRIETRRVKNECAVTLRNYLMNLDVRLDPRVFQALHAIAKQHAQAEIMVEKAVDVMLALDVAALAYRDEYDAAYLLTADGDYTPAAQAVRAAQKKVYAVSPANGAQLAQAVDSFIHLPAAWFSDCY